MKFVVRHTDVSIRKGCRSRGTGGRGTFQATPGEILYGADSIVECKYNVGCYSVPQP